MRCCVSRVRFAEGVRDPRFLERCLMVVYVGLTHRAALGTHKTVSLVEWYCQVRALTCVWVT